MKRVSLCSSTISTDASRTEQSIYWKQDIVINDANIPVGIPSSYSFLDAEDTYQLEPLFNYYLGFRLRVNSIFTLGAIYKSPLRAKFKREREMTAENFLYNFGNFEEEGELYFPESYGMGIYPNLR